MPKYNVPISYRWDIKSKSPATKTQNKKDILSMGAKSLKINKQTNSYIGIDVPKSIVQSYFVEL